MSGDIHDFSIESIAELERIAIKNVDEEEQWDFFDWFDDALAEKLEINENLNDLKQYHEEMMDKYNIGKKKLKSIIKDVTFVDQTHAKIWDQINDELSLYLKKITILNDTIKPSRLAYTSSEDLKIFLNKKDEEYKANFEATEANITLLNQYIEQELYPPEWWESLLSGAEGFVVSATRNLVFEPLFAILDTLELEDLSRNGVINLDNIEKWLRENTFDENAYLTGSKLGEITSIVAGIFEAGIGLGMIAMGGAGFLAGGTMVLTGVGAAPGGLTVAASSELIAAGSGILMMGSATLGSGSEKLGKQIEDSDVDLDDLQDVDTSLGEGASGAKLTNSVETQASINKKLETYLLDKNHIKGGSKAEWFDQALGYNQSNMNDLAKQIVFDPKTAIQTNVTQYGVQYNQLISITGANGKVVDVTFAWIRNKDGIIRLVTAIPTKK